MTERTNGASASAPLDHITQPVLNRPHEEPSRYWQLAEDNTSTGMAVKGRRPSQYLTIVPKVRDPQLQMEVSSIGRERAGEPHPGDGEAMEGREVPGCDCGYPSTAVPLA